MGVKLVSSGGGSVEINPPATASSYTATMPAGTGTVAVQGASTNIVSGTAVASTSGTSIDFTSIPSWVKRVTVVFNAVSTTGNSPILVQIGAGSVTTSGYSSYSGYITTSAVAGAASTSGFNTQTPAASNTICGSMVLHLLTGNTWASNHTLGDAGAALVSVGGGGIALAGTLDRVRITTNGGTETFDAGSINILYE